MEIATKIDIGADLMRVFKAQKANSLAISLTTADERIAKLRKIQEYLVLHQAEIKAVMYADFKKPAVEVVLAEIFALTAEIKFVCKNLNSWMKPQKVPTGLANVGTSSYIKHEPKGNILIIAPWNYPLSLCIKPLVSAIAAGNVAMVKPSEMTPNTSGFVKKMLNDLFDFSEVAVFEGDSAMATALLALPFNHIFYTGNPTVGKIVMKAAAEHLASVTLELGGKSPCIIDETADAKKIAGMLTWGKWLNNGQTCIAPDYLYVHESKKDDVIRELGGAIVRMYNADGRGVEHSDSYARMVNNRHFERVKSYIDDAVLKGAKVEIGGRSISDQNFIEPTVLTGVDDAMKVMQDEIFGPVLPIISYRNREEVIQYINAREKPLALYVMSNNAENTQYFMDRTSAGDSIINDLLLQFGNSELPFGGVNNSGIGKTNGFFGFQEFSNLRGMMKRNFGTMSFVYPPYTPKVQKLVDFFVKYL